MYLANLSSPDSSVTDRPRKIALQLVHHQGNESVEKAGDDLWDKHHIEIETDHGQGNSLDQEVHQEFRMLNEPLINQINQVRQRVLNLILLWKILQSLRSSGKKLLLVNGLALVKLIYYLIIYENDFLIILVFH
jgi:hypothetical protein